MTPTDPKRSLTFYAKQKPFDLLEKLLMPLSASDTKVVVWALRIVLAFWAVRYLLEGHWPLTVLAIVGMSPLITGRQAMSEPAFSRRAGFAVLVGLVLLLLGPHGLLSIWYEPSPYELFAEMIIN